jgi:uncharacterized coiled-coil DUF342 family protein
LTITDYLPLRNQLLRVFKPRENSMSSTSNEMSQESTQLRRRNAVTVATGRVRPSELISEAQKIKEMARDLFSRSHQLMVALKKHRKQARLTASTLRSLKQLRAIGA